MKIILASKSGVRKEILEKNNFNCLVSPSNVDEDQAKESLLDAGADPLTISKNLAELKSIKVSKSKSDKLVLGADSVVSLNNILINKPKNCITTVKDTHDRKTVMDIIEGACDQRLYPVGRLDRDTTGLLLLTNDGELTTRLTHPSFGIKKKYVIQLENSIHPDSLKEMVKGITLEDGEVKYDEVKYGRQETDRTQLIVTLHSGKNRVIRRTMEYFEKTLLHLDRIEFAGIKKNDLQRGQWRFLNAKEIGFLKMTKSR